jgi:hypothetical protein
VEVEKSVMVPRHSARIARGVKKQDIYLSNKWKENDE